MAENTPNLNLYLKDPLTDGNDTFNIETMLNENFRKIDNGFAEKNKITPKAVTDLPSAYPDGVSMFTLTNTAAGAWRTVVGEVSSGAAMVLTNKVTGSSGDFLIIQEVIFYSATLGQEKISGTYKRVSGANNSWKGAWQKVVSPEEFTTFQDDVASHLADEVKHITTEERTKWNTVKDLEIMYWMGAM